MGEWQPGDLALCVRASSRNNVGRPGAAYVVEHVVHAGGTFNGRNVVASPAGDTVGLFFEKHGCKNPAAASRFRKINPLTDEERRQALEDLKLPGMADA